MTSTFRLGLTLSVLAALLFCGPSGAVDLISPAPRLQFFDGSGKPLAGGKLFTYGVGSTTKFNTYTDNSGSTPNVNPIILNARGEPPSGIWLTPGQCYKYVLSPPTDSDPPTNAIWTVDGICGATSSIVTASTFGITVPAEFAATPGTQDLGSSIAISKATQSANTVWAGPASGSAAAPTFRALGLADGIRTRLSGDTTFWVCQTSSSPCTVAGSDSNAGTQDSPWNTIQTAWNTLKCCIDLAGLNATIQIGPGTYDGFSISGTIVGQATFRSVHFLGDETTPGNVVIFGNNVAAINGYDGAQALFSGLRLESTGSSGSAGVCLFAGPTSKIDFEKVSFGSCAVAQLATEGGAITAIGNYDIVSGVGNYHAYALPGGLIDFGGAAVTISGTPTFVIFASSVGGQIAANMSFSGSGFTGQSCQATLNGVVNTNTGSPGPFFPASSTACPTSLGGQVN